MTAVAVGSSAWLGVAVEFTKDSMKENNTPSSAELFVRMIGIIWFCAAIGAAFSKDSTCMGAALVVTVIAGLVYVNRHE